MRWLEVLRSVSVLHFRKVAPESIREGKVHRDRMSNHVTDNKLDLFGCRMGRVLSGRWMGRVLSGCWMGVGSLRVSDGCSVGWVSDGIVLW